MLSSQLKLSLSYYSDLYDMIVPKDHILRNIRELVVFSFIYDDDSKVHPSVPGTSGNLSERIN